MRPPMRRCRRRFGRRYAPAQNRLFGDVKTKEARVFHAIRMKCAGWNILRAACSETLRKKVSAMMAHARPGRSLHALRHLLYPLRVLFADLPRRPDPNRPRIAFGLACHRP